MLLGTLRVGALLIKNKPQKAHTKNTHTHVYVCCTHSPVSECWSRMLYFMIMMYDDVSLYTELLIICSHYIQPATYMVMTV